MAFSFLNRLFLLKQTFLITHEVLRCNTIYTTATNFTLRQIDKKETCASVLKTCEIFDQFWCTGVAFPVLGILILLTPIQIEADRGQVF